MSRGEGYRSYVGSMPSFLANHCEPSMKTQASLAASIVDGTHTQPGVLALPGQAGCFRCVSAIRRVGRLSVLTTASINDSDDPFERMLAVLRFAFTKDLKFVVRFIFIRCLYSHLLNHTARESLQAIQLCTWRALSRALGRNSRCILGRSTITGSPHLHSFSSLCSSGPSYISLRNGQCEEREEFQEHKKRS